jgi:ribosomal protein L23
MAFAVHPYVRGSQNKKSFFKIKNLFKKKKIKKKILQIYRVIFVLSINILEEFYVFASFGGTLRLFW